MPRIVTGYSIGIGNKFLMHGGQEAKIVGVYEEDYTVDVEYDCGEPEKRMPVEDFVSNIKKVLSGLIVGNRFVND